MTLGESVEALQSAGVIVTHAGKAARAEGVGFELTAPFRAPLPPAVELRLLRELGATGMALRLQLLQAQGVLP